MPWKESTPVSERMKFVVRLEQGERMSDLCREFGISRKTGYKFVERYKRHGAEGLFNQTRRPERLARSTPQPMQDLVLQIKEKHSTWGAAKIREFIRRNHKGVRLPARSTIHEILFRHGKVRQRRMRTRHWIGNTERASETERANQIWCADFKGQFRVLSGSLCYPLTVTDHFSRFVLGCDALESTKGAGAQMGFEQIFEEFGLPDAILSDNGCPFGSRGLFGLSRLSVWWIKLGIRILRIEPGHPEQNGRHERMHLTLLQDTTRPAGQTILQQQEKFDQFRQIFNHERPHEALGMKTPAEFYQPSTRVYSREVPDPTYPLHDCERIVTTCGSIYLTNKTKFFLSESFGNECVGLRQEEDGLWRVSFARYDLGLYDQREGTFYPFEGPMPS